MQAIGRADALLEGMQVFQQCSALLAAGQPEATIKFVLRFAAVAFPLGTAFLRSFCQCTFAKLIFICACNAQNSIWNVLLMRISRRWSGRDYCLGEALITIPNLYLHSQGQADAAGWLAGPLPRT